MTLRRRNAVQATRAGIASSLESRVLLAGNVSARLANGTLTIHGDGSNNAVNVIDDGAGNITITEYVNGTVNGGNDIVFASADVQNITISGKAGNDRFYVEGVKLTGNVKIDLDAGNDSGQVYFSESGV